MLGLDEDELAILALDDELLLTAALDDELLATTVGVEDELLELTPPLLPVLLMENQLRLNPPVIAVIPKLCTPAVKVIVRVMLVQFCQPPV